MRDYTDKQPVIDMPVAEGNFDNNILPRQGIVLHTTACTLTQALNLFNTPPSQRSNHTATSAHYIVDKNGLLYGMLEEWRNAFASGRYSPDATHPFANQNTLAVEHEDSGDYNDSVRTDMLYNTSAYLVADLCSTYGIPIDREHIRKHSEVSINPTGCPDGLDVDRIIATAQAYASGAKVWQGQGASDVHANPQPEAQPALVQPEAPVSTPAPTPALQTPDSVDKALFDQTVAERNSALTQSADLQKQTADLQSKYSAFVASGYASIEDVQKHISDLLHENTGLKTQVKQLNDENKAVSELFSQKCSQDATAVDAGVKYQELYNNLRTDVVSIAGLLKTKPDASKILSKVDELLRIAQEHKAEREHLTKLIMPSINYMEDFFAKLGLKAGENAK